MADKGRTSVCGHRAVLGGAAMGVLSLFVVLAMAACSAGAPSAASGAERIVTVTIVAEADQTGSDGTVSFTVTASPAPADGLEVAIRLTGTGTAMDPETVTATVAAGQTEAQISVVVDLSHARIVTAEVVEGSGYRVGDVRSAVVGVAADPSRVAPPEVEFGAVGLRSIAITWMPPDTSLTTTGYDVRWRTGTDQWAGNEDTIGGGETSYTIGELTSNTEYEVQVRAQFGDEVGIWSDSKFATPKGSESKPPQQIPQTPTLTLTIESGESIAEGEDIVVSVQLAPTSGNSGSVRLQIEDSSRSALLLNRSRLIGGSNAHEYQESAPVEIRPGVQMNRKITVRLSLTRFPISGPSEVIVPVIDNEA